jgi:putative transport protein
VGRPLGDLLPRLPPEVRVLVVRVGDENRHPEAGLVLGQDDVLLLGSGHRASLDAAREMLGEQAAGRVLFDRSRMDAVRVFVSRPGVVGTRVSDLRFPAGTVATVMHVQRGDTEMLVSPELTFELGDRVGLLADRASFQALRKHFGDSIRGTTEFSYVALGVGMVLGVLLGSIAFPVPVLGSLKMGVAGGSLIAALILGKLGRTGPLTWTMPLSANLTLRNFGLSLFLAQVGMSSGSPFVDVVSGGGLTYLAGGAGILFAIELTPLVVGHYVMRMPFDDLLGVTAGVTGTPAILAYAYRRFPSERVEICYAMIYPAATIVKIVFAQLLIALGRAGF